MNYLLDTNIVLTYLRDNKYSRRIEEKLHLFDFGNTLLVSIVVVAELKSIALQRKWGDKKVKNYSTC